MTVPKATVNEYDFLSSGKDKVGRPGEVASVQAVSIANSVEHPTNRHFGGSVSLADSGHDPRPCLSAEFVYQCYWSPF